jgi:hypothetical protein
MWLTDRKKQDKQRKSADYQRIMNDFAMKYPFYVKDNEIRYPIDDLLLLIYSELFDSEKKVINGNKIDSGCDRSFNNNTRLIRRFDANREFGANIHR